MTDTSNWKWESCRGDECHVCWRLTGNGIAWRPGINVWSAKSYSYFSDSWRRLGPLGRPWLLGLRIHCVLYSTTTDVHFHVKWTLFCFYKTALDRIKSLRLEYYSRLNINTVFIKVTLIILLQNFWFYVSRQILFSSSPQQ